MMKERAANRLRLFNRWKEAVQKGEKRRSYSRSRSITKTICYSKYIKIAASGSTHYINKYVTGYRRRGLSDME